MAEISAWPAQVKFGSRVFQLSNRLYYCEERGDWYGVYTRMHAGVAIELHLKLSRAYAFAYSGIMETRDTSDATRADG